MRPLILDFAVDRIGEYNPIFQYDDNLSLNVVDTENGKIPFIDISNENLILTTKTKVSGEVDDEGLSLLELQTKTRVKQEADDDSNSILELMTKTLVKQESDD